MAESKVEGNVPFNPANQIGFRTVLSPDKLDGLTNASGDHRPVRVSPIAWKLPVVFI